MNEPVLFQSLSKEQQIDFFIKCQEILVNSHPTSEFIITKENWPERKHYALDFINKYKGYVYYNNQICLLFNKIRINDPQNPVKALKDHIFKEPQSDYNAYSIDFACFLNIKNCLGFIKTQDNPQILYVLYVKNNSVKLYLKENLLKHLDSPLINFL
jgi:hypothetical protein